MDVSGGGASRSMKDGPLGFSVVPHKDKAFAHCLEISLLYYNSILPSVLGPFLRYDEDLGRPS